jgi:hypothetical protein
MHNMQTETANQPFHEWEPARRERLKIVSLGVIIDDLDTDTPLGQKLYRVLETFRCLLMRQYHGFDTDQAEQEQMKETIHTLDEVFLELRGQPEAEGWYFGIDSADNLAYGLGNMLITVRNELLLQVGPFAYKH